MITSTITKSENVASRFWNHCSSIVSHFTSKTSTINQLNWDKRFKDRKIKNETVVYTTTKCLFTSLIGREQLRDWQIWKTHVQSVQNFCARVLFIVKYANLGRCRHRRRDGCSISPITQAIVHSHLPLPQEEAWPNEVSHPDYPRHLFNQLFPRLHCDNMTRSWESFPTLNNRWIRCSTVLMKVEHIMGLSHLSELANPIG